MYITTCKAYCIVVQLLSFSLKYVNIAMVTILKNVTNILTALGELYMFRKHQNQKVWTAMFLMVISALLIISQKLKIIYILPYTCIFLVKFLWMLLFLLYFQIISAISSGITDISFDTVGYAWQFSNCILTASYSVSSNY